MFLFFVQDVQQRTVPAFVLFRCRWHVWHSLDFRADMVALDRRVHRSYAKLASSQLVGAAVPSIATEELVPM